MNSSKSTVASSISGPLSGTFGMGARMDFMLWSITTCSITRRSSLFELPAQVQQFPGANGSAFLCRLYRLLKDLHRGRGVVNSDQRFGQLPVDVDMQLESFERIAALDLARSLVPRFRHAQIADGLPKAARGILGGAQMEVGDCQILLRLGAVRFR